MKDRSEVWLLSCVTHNENYSSTEIQYILTPPYHILYVHMPLIPSCGRDINL